MSASSEDKPADEEGPDGGGDDPRDHRQSARLRRMLADLLDSGQAFRRGSQEVVAGVAQGTKEELVRLISSEVRGFLDKMDAVDLMQEIIAGLVVEVKAEVRFRRDPESGTVSSSVRSDTQLKNREGREPRESKEKEEARPRDEPRGK